MLLQNGFDDNRIKGNVTVTSSFRKKDGAIRILTFFGQNRSKLQITDEILI